LVESFIKTKTYKNYSTQEKPNYKKSKSPLAPLDKGYGVNTS